MLDLTPFSCAESSQYGFGTQAAGRSRFSPHRRAKAPDAEKITLETSLMPILSACLIAERFGL